VIQKISVRENEHFAPRCAPPLLRAIKKSWHQLVGEADTIDQALYASVAATRRPGWDAQIARLSDSADFSRLWLGIAGGQAILGGRPGRRAAVRGVLAVGVASMITNAGLKTFFRRGRPPRRTRSENPSVRMPTSGSFPSGHTASAFAFAAAVDGDCPLLAVPVLALATAVGYARIYTGVHYPGDVLGGALVGYVTGCTVRTVLMSRRFEKLTNRSKEARALKRTGIAT
jgi:membrane-associated phospholipid phosphatase